MLPPDRVLPPPGVCTTKFDIPLFEAHSADNLRQWLAYACDFTTRNNTDVYVRFEARTVTISPDTPPAVALSYFDLPTP